MMYRIITENKNRDRICNVVSLNFDGFTVYETTGYYKGGQENVLIVEIDVPVPVYRLGTKKYYRNRIFNICRIIKVFNEQECILLQQVKSKSRFL